MEQMKKVPIKNNREKDELDKLDLRLKEVLKDFQAQLASLGTKSSDFHVSLVEIISKNPEQKEMINFIVHVNDKLETNQNIYSDIVNETIKQNLSIQRDITKVVKNIIKQPTSKKHKDIESFANMLYLYKYRIIAVYILSLLVLVGVIISPDTMESVMNFILKMK